jgi:DNA-directed RNA polymerase specialized sigma24 family protein
MTMNDVGNSDYLTPEEIERRIFSLSAADCVRLVRIAGIYSGGSDWSPADLMQEAFVAVLERRRWRPDLDTTVFLTGVMRSLAHARRKGRRANALDHAMSGGEALHGELDALADDDDRDPAEAVAAEQELLIVLKRLEEIFDGDDEVGRVILGRASGETPAEIKAALGMNQTQYETVCRRLLRAYQTQLKVQRT